MGVHGEAKRRRPDESSSAGDLISGLGDDVLVRILELVPDARDAVRTGALSRRWRGLWTRIPDLRFASASWPELSAFGARGGERFAAMVDGALALRAAQTEPAIENLAISFKLKSVSSLEEAGRVVPLSITAAERWIRFAVLHELKSLDLELRLPSVRKSVRLEPRKTLLPRTVPSGIYKVTALDSLPGSARMGTMRLALCRATVQLPSTAVFASLTDLTLEHMMLADGSVHLLARLLSSACCPRLQKFRLGKIGILQANEAMVPDLPVEASALLELSLERISDPLDLKLRTPSLRVLRIKNCSIDAITLSAPKLERLMYLGHWHYQPNCIYVEDELPGVQMLSVELCSHDVDDDDDDGDDEGMNYGAIQLLRSCTLLKCLDVSLQVPPIKDQIFDAMKDRIPHLPQVTSLTVRASIQELHSFRASVASLLTECRNLRHLRIHLEYRGLYNINYISQLNFFCDHLDHWKSHEITFSHLEKVEFRGLAGTDCDIWFMQFVLSRATRLRKATVNFKKRFRLQDTRDDYQLLPLLDDGTWIFCRDTYYLSYE